MVNTYRGHRSVGHGGHSDGFTSDVCLFPDDGLGIVVLTNKDGTPLPDIIALHAAERLLGLDPIDWLAEGLDRRKKDESARKDEAVKKTKTGQHPGTHAAHPLEEYAGEYEHPGYGLLKIEIRDGRLVSIHNGIEFTLEHWHFEIFDAPKADNDPTLDNLSWKHTFQTNLKGYVDAVAVPLQSNVKPIVFTKRPDKKLSDPEYLKRFAGEYENAGETMTIRLQGHVLMFEQKDARTLELVPDRDDAFNLKQDARLSLRFVTNTRGKVVELDLIYPDEVNVAKRKP